MSSCIQRYQFHFFLASIEHHQCFNHCQNYSQIIISMYSSLRVLVILNFFTYIISPLYIYIFLSVYFLCSLLYWVFFVFFKLICKCFLYIKDINTQFFIHVKYFTECGFSFYFVILFLIYIHTLFELKYFRIYSSVIGERSQKMKCLQELCM